MVLLAALYLIALAMSFFSFFEDRKDVYTLCIFLAVVLLLWCVVAFRPIGSDADSLTYMFFYHDLGKEFIEISFVWIVALVHWLFDDVRWLFIIYAVLSVFLHAEGIRRLSPALLLSVLLWLSHYFIIQDFTQIRVAVSTGLFLIGLSFLAERRRLVFFFFIAGAIFAHYSALAYLPVLFFSNRKLGLKGRIFLAGSILFMYVLYFAGVDLIFSLPIPYLEVKIDDYERLRDSGMLGDTINVFNVVFLLRIFVFFYILVKYEYIVKYHTQITLLLKVYCCSLCSFLALSSLPIMAGRVSELFGIVEIVLFPMILCTIRPLAVGRGILVVFALGLLSLNLWYNDLINFI